MKYEDIYFDFDGTLVNTVEGTAESAKFALELYQQKMNLLTQELKIKNNFVISGNSAIVNSNIILNKDTAIKIIFTIEQMSQIFRMSM